jgi:hypothetical protein
MSILECALYKCLLQNGLFRVAMDTGKASTGQQCAVKQAASPDHVTQHSSAMRGHTYTQASPVSSVVRAAASFPLSQALFPTRL